MRRVWRFWRRHAVATGGALYALTLGIGVARHRQLIATMARHFGLRDHPTLELPPVRLSEITNSDTEVVLPAPEAADGNVSPLELVALARLVRERAPSRIFEIGTFDGRTTLALAANAPANASVHTLDLPPDGRTVLGVEPADRRLIGARSVGARIQGTAHARRIQQHFGDSATFDFSGHRADFVFVDGSHAYEYVMNDSRRAVDLLAGGPGTIVWHDYGEWEGVTVALNELLRTDPCFAGLRHIEGTSLAVLFR